MSPLPCSVWFQPCSGILLCFLLYSRCSTIQLIFFHYQSFRPLTCISYRLSSLIFPACQWSHQSSPDLDCMADVLMGFHRSTFSKSNTEFSSDLASCDIWAFPTMKREIRGKKLRSDQQVCSTFSRSGWSIVRNASLAKVGTSKKRPSPYLHKVPARSNKVKSTNVSNGPHISVSVHRQRDIKCRRHLDELYL
jgi:hypothetical protein